MWVGGCSARPGPQTCRAARASVAALAATTAGAELVAGAARGTRTVVAVLGSRHAGFAMLVEMVHDRTSAFGAAAQAGKATDVQLALQPIAAAVTEPGYPRTTRRPQLQLNLTLDVLTNVVAVPGSRAAGTTPWCSVPLPGTCRSGHGRSDGDGATVPNSCGSEGVRRARVCGRVVPLAPRSRRSRATRRKLGSWPERLEARAPSRRRRVRDGGARGTGRDRARSGDGVRSCGAGQLATDV